MEEMAVSLNLIIKAIEKNIKQLKEHNLIERVGPDRGGHWKVLS
jgi:ATP-dependent DNA helicase RecG